MHTLCRISRGLRLGRPITEYKSLEPLPRVLCSLVRKSTAVTRKSTALTSLSQMTFIGSMCARLLRTRRNLFGPQMRRRLTRPH